MFSLREILENLPWPARPVLPPLPGKAIARLSENIIDGDQGFGFILTEFFGGVDRGVMYQINVGGNFVVLTDAQMQGLTFAFVNRHNQRLIDEYAKKDPRIRAVLEKAIEQNKKSR